MISPAFFFGPVEMFTIVLVSLVGGCIAGKAPGDRAVKIMFGSVALFFLWGLIFGIFYVAMGLFSEILPFLSMDHSTVLARGLAAGCILWFYLRWVIEQHRAPVVKGGLVLGPCKSRRNHFH